MKVMILFDNFPTVALCLLYSFQTIGETLVMIMMM